MSSSEDAGADCGADDVDELAGSEQGTGGVMEVRSPPSFPPPPPPHLLVRGLCGGTLSVTSLARIAVVPLLSPCSPVCLSLFPRIVAHRSLATRILAQLCSSCCFCT